MQRMLLKVLTSSELLFWANIEQYNYNIRHYCPAIVDYSSYTLKNYMWIPLLYTLISKNQPIVHTLT